MVPALTSFQRSKAGNACHSVTGPVGPHAEGRVLDIFRVAVAERRVISCVVPFADVADLGSFLIRVIAPKRRAEAGVVPGIDLLQAPDLEGPIPGIADGD